MTDTFLYPRTVTIKRPAPTATGGGGNVGYSGIQASHASDTTIATGLPCAIKAKAISATRRTAGAVPADAPGPVAWDILMPPINGFTPGSIRDRDFAIADDTGEKFLIVAACWSPISWQLGCIKLEG
jgi:hypothetical protein